jgi:hypothetical protein
LLRFARNDSFPMSLRGVLSVAKEQTKQSQNIFHNVVDYVNKKLVICPKCNLPLNYFSSVSVALGTAGAFRGTMVAPEVSSGT